MFYADARDEDAPIENAGPKRVKKAGKCRTNTRGLEYAGLENAGLKCMARKCGTGKRGTLHCSVQFLNTYHSAIITSSSHGEDGSRPQSLCIRERTLRYTAL